MAGKTYEHIKAAHIKEYQQYFNTFSINLGRSANEVLPTDERIEKFATSQDPSFVALYVQYGRYLLISASRPGTRPANLQGIWNIGDKVFSNRQTEFNSLPSNLFGADWVLHNLKSNPDIFNYHFKGNRDLFVAIRKGFDSSLLKGYENGKTQIITDENGGTVYYVYRKRFKKNDSVSVKVDSNMIVCLQTVSNMQPAYDLKPVTAYHADLAITGDGVERNNQNGRLCAVVKINTTSVVQWLVQTGVADRYSITVKYYFSGKAVNGYLQLLDAGGHIMLNKQVRFNFTREEKWNQFTLITDDMINAGNYVVKLIVTDAKGLAVSGIEIQ